MAELLRMPEVSANAGSAVLMAWSVRESDAFSAEDTLAEVETDKAVVDIEAESDGVLLRTLVPAGTEVAVGTPIALLGDPADRDGDLDALLAGMGVRQSVADTLPDPASVVVRREVPDAPGGPDGHARAAVGETLDSDEDPAAAAAAAGAAGSGETRAPDDAPPAGVDRVFASPLARRLAQQAGLPLRGLVGSGPHGRIRRSDVEAAVRRRAVPAEAVPGATPPTSPAAGSAATSPPLTTPVQDSGHWDDEPHSRIRRVIAARLTESKATVPHFYLRAAVRADRLLSLRREFNGDTGSSVSVNDMVIKAVARAHVLVPDMNVIWTPEAIRRFREVDVAVAVASRRGLVTPTLRGVQTLPVGGVHDRVKEMVERAHAGRLHPDELTGGSVTVSNLGMFGVQEFAAIINPPHSAIVAVGAAAPEAVVDDGHVAVATVLHLTVSVDHRAVDGAVAARWLSALTATLQAPLSILA